MISIVWKLLFVTMRGSYLFGGYGINVGWRITGVSGLERLNNESWFNAPWVNNLKLREPVLSKTATSGVSAFHS
ncbi:hypothetical protein NXW86_29780 [Bacteroides thetaiotaomicron]|uniref:hypothetical protein n=1 Tax=Bacteroides thetaiotaomicron TaxID=818 RepID=UPI0021668A7D|nr:hypothetical protein [Bacteroides thetaiotaomicron]MCS2453157.1 hypothetical protein [Bacteroides thetaiotaomicron]